MKKSKIQFPKIRFIDVIEKTKKVFFSCQSLEQMETANNYFELLVNAYERSEPQIPRICSKDIKMLYDFRDKIQIQVERKI